MCSARIHAEAKLPLYRTERVRIINIAVVTAWYLCSIVRIKVTKPIITIANNGDEQETLKVITLTLREPPVPPSCDVSVTPPAACTPQRIRRDLEFSRNLIMFLGRSSAGKLSTQNCVAVICRASPVENPASPALWSPFSWFLPRRRSLSLRVYACRHRRLL